MNQPFGVPVLWFSETSSLGKVTIRRGRAPDAAAIARVYVDSWRSAYKGLIPQTYLNSLSYDAFERHWRRTFASRAWAFVAEYDGQIVGIASGGRCRKIGIASGELFILYVLNEYHGNGIGRALFDACQYELTKRGHPDILVWVLEENPARGFYERLGGELVYHNQIDIGGKPMREAGYLWRD